MVSLVGLIWRSWGDTFEGMQYSIVPVLYSTVVYRPFHSVNIFHANSGINRLKFPSLDFLFSLSRCNTVSAPESSQVPIPAGLATCNSFFPGTPCSFVGLIALSFHPSFIYPHHISLSLRCCRTRNLFSLLTAVIE